MSTVMKFTLVSLLYGLLAGWFASSDGTRPLQPSAVIRPPAIPATVACPNIPLTATEPALGVSTSGRELKPTPPPERSITLNDPSRRWVFSDKTWRSINESVVNIDVCVDRGQEYFGVRIVLPFGS
jgi:hypothetical protein